MRLTFVLALVSAFTGCVAAPPRGPHAEYRAGMTPVAHVVSATGSYLLHSAGTTVAVQHVEKGQPLGFARQPDGTVVAVAPDFALPLTQPGYIWEAVEGSVVRTPSLARRTLHAGGKVAGGVALLLVALAGGIAYATAVKNSDSQR